MALSAIMLVFLLALFIPFQSARAQTVGTVSSAEEAGGEVPSTQEPPDETEAGSESESALEPSESENTPGSETDVLPEEEPDEGVAQAAPKAYVEGQVTINNVVYAHHANGQASIINGSKATGVFTVPKEITGSNGETYQVTRIASYTAGERLKGAFEGSKITGLAFEEGINLQYIADFAFSACYGLSGSSIQLPASLTYIGTSAFHLYIDDIGLGELRHSHVVQVSGALPNLEAGGPLELPPEALDYESMVDSSQGNTTLHKAASWVNEGLTEAEIRIDYGKRPVYSGKVDFVFVLDYSNSMLATAQATGANGTQYTYPRSLLTNDVVYGAAEILLNSGLEGYDNRVAMVAFGSGYEPIWTSDFTSSSAAVEETLFQHPLSTDNDTSYGAGLKGAIDVINSRQDKSRQAVVVFLSDGAPNVGYGVVEAKTLRDMGVKVYPIAIFTQPNTYLTAISYNQKTAYNAQNADAFESIIMQVVEDIIEQGVPLEISLQDILSEQFTLATGTQADITVSTGSASFVGNAITWDLTGAEAGVVHSMKIKVRLKTGSELSATGALPTNTSLGAADGSLTTSAQPQLERYLKHHLFENGSDAGQPLPDAIMSLLPESGGGYRNHTPVTPAAVTTEVELPSGDKWVFDGWDMETAEIDSADVTFTGVWRRAGLVFDFTKTDGVGTGLAGAGFDLYVWQGGNAPEEQDAYIVPENTVSGKWVKTNSAPIVSGQAGSVRLNFPGEGCYQLVEAAQSPGFYLPQVQWRFAVGQNSTLQSIATIPKNDAEKHLVDFIKTTHDGTDTWSLPNYLITEFYFFKISSQHGSEVETSSVGLQGAEFELYFWAGAQAPSPDLLVTQEGVEQGLWQLAGTATSQTDGRVSFTIPAKEGWIYQLVETKPPENHQMPSGQWRVGFTPQNSINEATITQVPGVGGALPPRLETALDGKYGGQLALVNIPKYELPAMGGIGNWPFIGAGALLLLAGALTGILLAVRKRKRRAKRLAARLIKRPARKHLYKMHANKRYRPPHSNPGGNTNIQV